MYKTIENSALFSVLRNRLVCIKLFSVFAVFILRPTSARMWHKAVFRVGLVAGPKPNTTVSSKNASGLIGIPLCGAPGDKPNPSEDG